jgi:hypothetical protein
MDLKTGYHQVHMQTTNTWKTTFKTKFGLFEWMLMPFGLMNGPSTFMSLINDIFILHLGKFVVIYLDDILIFINSWKYHLQHVCRVLELLRNHKLQVKENKSFFGHTYVQYFGFIVDTQGVHPNPSRVKDLEKWPTPSNTYDLKSFMGGINFYRKIVYHFSQMAQPLHQLSHQEKIWWTLEDERHFMKLKTTLCSTPILRLPDMNQPF